VPYLESPLVNAQLQPLTTGTTEPIVLHIERADDELLVIKEEQLIYRHMTGLRPPLPHQVPINDFLEIGGRTRFSFVGIDWGGASHFKFHITVGGRVQTTTKVDQSWRRTPAHRGKVVAFWGLIVDAR
jgi:hypothetical protein